MSYQQGYPQQSSGVYQPGYPEVSRGASPAAAIIAAVLALVAAASLLVANFKRLSDIPDGISFSDWPGEFKTVVILWFGAALVLLVGAIIVFIRKIAGAFITVLGGLAGIAAVLLYPVIVGNALGVEIPMSEYLKEMFKFDGADPTFTAIALIASPLALIVAILPPTLRYLKGSGGGDDFSDYGQQQQYPQQTYPQQQAYQQQQPGGYPQQPQQPNW